MKDKLIKTFTELIRYNTTSDPNSDTFPSTEYQEVFGEILAGKLSTMGLDTSIDKYGYVYATIPSNADDRELPVIGFIAHMDTSPDFSGENIKPNIIEKYEGNDIVLKGVTISPEEFPSLLEHKGDTIITSDGTTLLGADDKAGIAEILTAAEYFIEHPEVKHGTIKIAFTPDEEIGKGVDYFDTEKFGCDFAYTIDGGREGEVNYENFNAASAVIDIKGKNVHPGYAKDIMINAAHIGSVFNGALPQDCTPSQTEGHQGFYHLTEINGNVSHCHMEYIIREFDKEKFLAMKKEMENNIKATAEKFGCHIDYTIKDQYYNMWDIISQNEEVVQRALNAVKEAEAVPITAPIRGGTDGAMLSYKGLPCPNIFTGGYNFHGPYEFVSVDAMVKAVNTIINIAKLQ